MERAKAYLLGNEIFALMLVVSIYPPCSWDNVVDEKHKAIVTQTYFPRAARVLPPDCTTVTALLEKYSPPKLHEFIKRYDQLCFSYT